MKKFILSILLILMLASFGYAYDFIKCLNCNGTGIQDCWWCKGDGWQTKCYYCKDKPSRWVICEDCRGKGTYVLNGQRYKCNKCYARGKYLWECTSCYGNPLGPCKICKGEKKTACQACNGMGGRTTGRSIY